MVTVMCALVVTLSVGEDTPHPMPKLSKRINTAGVGDFKNWPFFLVEVAATAEHSISKDILSSSERKLGGQSFESLIKTLGNESLRGQITSGQGRRVPR